jgi:hypothetical protein
METEPKNALSAAAGRAFSFPSFHKQTVQVNVLCQINLLNENCCNINVDTLVGINAVRFVGRIIY